jgi:hypothetical protein
LTGGAPLGGDPPPLEPGDPVTLREVWEGRILAARPVRVVEDVPSRHRAFWFAPGTRWMNDPRDHGEVRFLDTSWELEARVLDRGVLSFSFPDTPYAVLMNTDEAGAFTGYYVNIESALRPWEGGFDYTDWFLDVRIPIDRSSYAWKDEVELAEAMRRGLMSRREAHDIRRAGERAIEHVLLREPPFDEPWEDWRPDPGWNPPELAPGWDVVA